MKKIDKFLKIGLGLAELLLAVPILGASIVISTGWTILGIMFILHIAGLAFAYQQQKATSGYIVGMITNIIAFIPFVGMFFHGVTGTILLVQGLKDK